MKNIIVLISLTFLVSCGSNSEKKKGFEYNRTQKVEKKADTTVATEVPIDMDNKGIGPIKSLVFLIKLIKRWRAKGKRLLNKNVWLVIYPIES